MNKLLWLDDMRCPSENDWAEWIIKYGPVNQPCEVIWVKSYQQFTEWIKKNGLPDGICFDHDLGEDVAKEKVKRGMSKRKARQEKKLSKSGMDCAKWTIEYCMDNKLSLPPYSIQSANPAGRENIDGILKSFIKHSS